jgi:hypothetical protein
MADKPVDTEGARADLRFGNQYFDRWFKQDLPKQKEETLSQVLNYTEQARKKDPSVTLQVKSEEGEVKQVTPPTAWRQRFTSHTDHTKRSTPKLGQAGFADENTFTNQSPSIQCL